VRPDEVTAGAVAHALGQCPGGAGRAMKGVLDVRKMGGRMGAYAYTSLVQSFANEGQLGR
jgi:hypothetical protein